MDESTLLATYREHVHALYAFVSRRCGGDRALAEDVTQEVWLRAVAEWRRKGLPDRPLAWLRTVARNLLVNYHRRIRPVSLDASPPQWDGQAPAGPLEFESTEQAALVNWGMSRLRPGQARLLEAFYFDGSKVAEIASDLGLSERAVEGRLRRARTALRRHLESASGPERRTRG